ncbi:FAS1-like dehydratase domain-containing protein [Tomitella gaofuii]|uniref:FAS1-like dehydratase domain-containing protein n=1 Tax=Tomitella gaofuii TaxID=2760083 RepID=UPI0015FC14C6|nr:MaoC family dehydratase N-terminal domain-containing protein [Tomitella gaofuii]
MADPAAVGTEGAPFRLDVERGKIREFARATGTADLTGIDAQDAPVSQPTFLTTALHWQTGDANPWPAVKLDQQRGLHAEQEFTFFGAPPRAGTRLEGRARISDIYTKQGRRGGEMTFAVMVTDYYDESGRLVAQAKMTGVETARPPKEDEA